MALWSSDDVINFESKKETQQRYYGRTFKMHAGRYNQNHKIFIKITKIGPNEYFTLENKAASNPFTIVSQGATVVRIKNDFLNGMKMHTELLRRVFKLLLSYWLRRSRPNSDWSV